VNFQLIFVTLDGPGGNTQGGGVQINNADARFASQNAAFTNNIGYSAVRAYTGAKSLNIM